MVSKLLALAGGVGGAKLCLGFAHEVPAKAVTIVVNTGDDETFHGLHISPDLDTVMYTLAGLANQDTGWGLAGETFQSLSMLELYGSPTWFTLGDKDLATHIWRTQRQAQGYTLSQITQDLCHSLGVAPLIAPMSDQPLRTIVLTDHGECSLQEYFVRLGWKPSFRGIRMDGVQEARPSPAFVEALQNARTLVYCPSNPIISIEPILSVPGVRDAIASFQGPRVAISPIAGGQALRGPLAKMLHELGEEVSCTSVARRYQGLCDIFVIDSLDLSHKSNIEALGMDVFATNTIMNTIEDKRALAQTVLHLSESYGYRS